MLLYLGARAVALLDGGLAAWQRMGGTVRHEPESVPSGEFSVFFRRERRRTVTELEAGWEDGERPLLVDARSCAEYAGDGQYYLPRRGHIPGAALVPFQSLYSADGAYVDAQTYLARLPRDLQVARDVVAYCEVGVRAAVFALMHEAYTGRIIPVCDGSVVEWALTTLLPLRMGEAREQDGTYPAAPPRSIRLRRSRAT